MKEAKPQEVTKFSKTTESTSSVVKVGDIISVVRQHDDEDILRPCSEIPAILRTEAADSSSLHYRSKYNPAFYELNGSIYAVPSASGSGNNDIVVTQVHYDTGLTHDDSDSGIDNFPQEYAYLVALYAAIKCIEVQLADMNLVEEDPELAQTLTQLLMSFGNDYRSAFAKPQAEEGGV